jgi:predicted nicotinamide N-methyase
VWPTAVAVSRWLLEQAPGSLPRCATDLGCGVGLVSLTLAHLGVLALGTDRQPLALDFCAENMARNALTGFTGAVRDFSEAPGPATQLLLASDIVYDAASPALLFTLVQTAGLLAPGGRLLLGTPHARTELADVLVGSLRGVGYAHALLPHTIAWEGRDEPIDLHLLTRPLGAGPTARRRPGRPSPSTSTRRPSS